MLSGLSNGNPYTIFDIIVPLNFLRICGNAGCLHRFDCFCNGIDKNAYILEYFTAFLIAGTFFFLTDASFDSCFSFFNIEILFDSFFENYHTF